MENLKINKIETAKTATFTGEYNGYKIHIFAKEALTETKSPIIQFYIGCEFYYDFKCIYKIPDGAEIKTEKGFFDVAYQLLFENIDEILQRNSPEDIDYRTIYNNDMADGDEDFFGDYDDDYDEDLKCWDIEDEYEAEADEEYWNYLQEQALKNHVDEANDNDALFDENFARGV